MSFFRSVKKAVRKVRKLDPVGRKVNKVARKVYRKTGGPLAKKTARYTPR